MIYVDGCEKCHLAQLIRTTAGFTNGRVTGELYTFSLINPSQEITWSMDVAQGYIRAGLVKLVELWPPALRTWLDTYVDVDVNHLDHLPAGAADKPGIVIAIVNIPAPTMQPEVFPILLDGTHRAYRALREGRPFFAWSLTEEQQRDCRIRHTVNGRTIVQPAPVPGYGHLSLESSVLLRHNRDVACA